MEREKRMTLRMSMTREKRMKRRERRKGLRGKMTATKVRATRELLGEKV